MHNAVDWVIYSWNQRSMYTCSKYERIYMGLLLIHDGVLYPCFRDHMCDMNFAHNIDSVLINKAANNARQSY